MEEEKAYSNKNFGLMLQKKIVLIYAIVHTVKISSHPCDRNIPHVMYTHRKKKKKSYRLLEKAFMGVHARRAVSEWKGGGKGKREELLSLFLCLEKYFYSVSLWISVNVMSLAHFLFFKALSLPFPLPILWYDKRFYAIARICRV